MIWLEEQKLKLQIKKIKLNDVIKMQQYDIWFYMYQYCLGFQNFTIQ